MKNLLFLVAITFTILFTACSKMTNLNSPIERKYWRSKKKYIKR